MTMQTALFILLYLAAMCAVSYVLALGLAYVLRSPEEHAARVAARLAAHNEWVAAQPPTYHAQRMTETYR